MKTTTKIALERRAKEPCVVCGLRPVPPFEWPQAGLPMTCGQCQRKQQVQP